MPTSLAAHTFPAEADGATGTIRVAVAGHRTLARAGLRVLLDREAGIAVVGEAATADEAIALARRTRPDVVLLDVHAPREALTAARRLLAEPGIVVMILASSADDDRALASLRADAGPLLLEDADPAELIRAVRALAHGCQVIPLSTRFLSHHRPKENRMLTPKVVELRRGGAHRQGTALPKRPTAALALVR